ncbi:hypothetical protein B0H10DRAFT_1967786 [Mycena sp. CBHHK59/15]|nr:hypothetical protein B0H10DRAFT_1967786 [Mycena sp. CBHHK59/15]
MAEYLQRSKEYADVLEEMETLRNGGARKTQSTNLDNDLSGDESNSSTSSSDSDKNQPQNLGRISSPDDRDSISSTPSSSPSARSGGFISPAPSSSPSARSCGSAASRLAADCVEEWDTVDHSDEPLCSGSDLAVRVDPETGRLCDDWYEPEEFEDLLKRLCGPDVEEGKEESEGEELESDEPESESDGEDETRQIGI